MKTYKMNRKARIWYIIALLLAITANNLYSQVTIGSNIHPVEGALLQLTEGENTTRGLLLPRVMLTSLANLDDINPSSAERPDENAHIGLMVYNVANDEVCPTINPGVYIWNGNNWQRLGKDADFLSDTEGLTGAGVLIETDQDGNTFAAASFGDAGIWMLHNLAVKNFADGTPINIYNGVQQQGVASYTYPNVNSGDWGEAPETYKRNQGLLYSWAAATKGYSPENINQAQADTSGTIGANEVENNGTGGTAPAMYVQGVCPNGWHLPSDREWNQLEKEVYMNPSKYSTYAPEEIPFIPSWNSDWEVANGDRGVTTDGAKGHGAVLKEQCEVSYFQNIKPTNGKSLPLEKKGFNAKLVGAVSSILKMNYGTYSYYWSSSSFNEDVAWMRTLIRTKHGITRNTFHKGDLISVRSKKNP